MRYQEPEGISIAWSRSARAEAAEQQLPAQRGARSPHYSETFSTKQATKSRGKRSKVYYRNYHFHNTFSTL